jgi:opacity protein-like surface antigen
MKKKFFSCVVVFSLMLLLAAGPAFAAEPLGIYFGVSGGHVIPQTMTISDPDGGGTYLNAGLNNGYNISVRSGWNTTFTRRIMAMEIEYNYFRNNIDNSKIVPSPDNGGYPVKWDGNLSVHALLFNLKARYPEGRFHPYIGGGLGYAYMSVGDITETAYDGSGSDVIAGQSGGGFCWQFLTGLDFDITPNFGVNIGYKYFATKPTVGSKNSDEMYADFDYRTSVITAGLTFTF